MVRAMPVARLNPEHRKSTAKFPFSNAVEVPAARKQLALRAARLLTITAAAP
jgi:hypothetical protein